MSFDDREEQPKLSQTEIEKLFVMPVYTEEEMNEKFKDWHPQTNYRGQLLKAEHTLSKEKRDPMVKLLFKFKVERDKTKLVSKVLMMYPEDHSSFDWAYEEQEKFLRAVGMERVSEDLFVKLDKFVDKFVDATFTENESYPDNPNIKFIDAGVVNNMKKTQETFDDDINFS